MAAMTESKDSNVGVNIVKGETLDGERALYNLRGALVEGCRFTGPADGESALKECRDVTVRGCDFELRYPLWHARGFSIESCRMTDTCRMKDHLCLVQQQIFPLNVEETVASL